MASDQIEQRLAELVALPRGWASYHDEAEPVRQETADRTRLLLEDIGVPPDTVLPIPSSKPYGSWVQVEWSPPDHYVKIEINPAGGFNFVEHHRVKDAQERERGRGNGQQGARDRALRDRI